MARDWSEVFIVARPDLAGGGAVTLDVEGPEAAAPRRLRRLRDGLARTRRSLSVRSRFRGKIDAETWEDLEEALILADVGAALATEAVGQLERAARSDGLSEPDALAERLGDLLADSAQTGEARIDIRAHPAVIVFVGVNGTGKTTSAGKLAWHCRRTLGASVVLVAADTFRAAASEQLRGWGERVGVEVIEGPPGGDPAAVVFEALARARESDADIVIVDTAGRLHTRADLMDELGKVQRVIAKQLPGAPHETLLTIDASTGQNGLSQARVFTEVADVTGVVLTKLDGTAKGGIALAIARELGIPVKLVGVGEAPEDLQPFDAHDFAQALLE